MGTPDFAVPSLKELIKAGYEILGVVSQPDRPRGRGKKLQPPPVKVTAIEAGLSVLQPVNIKDTDFLSTMASWQPDVIVVVAFGRILPQEILNLPKLGCINLHASLLPKYRGAAPIHRAIMNGEKVTGNSTMWISQQLDAGDIILQEELPIESDATTGEIHDQLAVMGAKLLTKTLDLLKKGKAPRQVQDESKVTYALPIKPEEERINWEQPVEVIYNQIRGLNPWPGSHTLRSGKRLKIYRSRILDKDKTGLAGQVVNVTKEGFVVQTGCGQLLITEVQPPGKKIMSASDYLRGYPVNIGEVLGCV